MNERVVAAGNYETVLRHGDTVFVAGMTPKSDNALVAHGQVGGDIAVARGVELAALAAQRAVSAITESGVVDGPVIPLSMTVFISSSSEFREHAHVADGASRVIAEWAGGRQPVRAAVGVSSLPGGAPVEVMLTVAIA